MAIIKDIFKCRKLGKQELKVSISGKSRFFDPIEDRGYQEYKNLLFKIANNYPVLYFLLDKIGFI